MLKDLFYAIKTGDTKTKIFYSFALVIVIAGFIGFIAGGIGIAVALAAGNTQVTVPVILAVVSLVLAIGVIIWLNKLRRL